MTTETKKPVAAPTWDKKEKDAIADYGCELLLENASQEELKKTCYPSDAMIVTYKVKDKVHFDLCRGSKVNIFDLYYCFHRSNLFQLNHLGYRQFLADIFQ